MTLYGMCGCGVLFVFLLFSAPNLLQEKFSDEESETTATKSRGVVHVSVPTSASWEVPCSPM